MAPTLSLVLLLSLAGCEAPPEAPGELDDLCAYLFSHVGDESPDALQDGLTNADLWLVSHLDETLEGYGITTLERDAVEALEGEERDLTGLVGVAVGAESEHDVLSATLALLDEDQTEVLEQTYDVFEREWVTDQNCFLEQRCETLEAVHSSEVRFALGVRVSSQARAQFRWVDTWAGTVLVGRSWLVEPPEINVSWLEVDQQYYLQAILPDEDGGSRRLQAIWVVGEFAGGEPSDGLKALSVRALQHLDEDLEAWLDAG